MRLLPRLITAIILLFPFTALAHGYWIELEGSHQPQEKLVIRLIFGEYILSEKLSGDKLDRMKEIKVWVQLPDGSRQPVDMKQQPDCWSGLFTPGMEGSFTVIAVNDEREVQDWTKHGLGIVRPVQYLKASYQVGKSSPPVPASLFLNIDITKKSGNQFEALLSKNDSAFGTYLITIVSPSGDEEEMITAADGTVVFDVKGKGLYLVSVEWIDKTPGLFKAKEYKTVRHRLDYSLYAE